MPIFQIFGDKTAPLALDEHEEIFCEGKINETEIAEALKVIKNGSAPGSDRLATKF